MIIMTMIMMEWNKLDIIGTNLLSGGIEFQAQLF